MKFLVPCAFAFLAVAAPALAADRHSIANSTGEMVYDMNGSKIGTIQGESRGTGDPSAIVTKIRGNKDVLIAEQLMHPRDSGGWSALVDPATVASLPAYVPPAAPPAAN